MIMPEFFRDCALISVDIQEGERGPDTTEEKLPPDWKKMGFTAADVNAATAFSWEVCLPNAVRCVEACRAAGLKMIFIHWGFRCPDGMDLDPEIYQTMLRNHGNDAAFWSGYIEAPGSQPAKVFQIQSGEYVIAKSGQDAFSSSNIDFVLRNLGIRNLVFIGGHTGACLGKTARSAKERGYTTLCVEDATSDARESTRLPNIEAAGFDYCLTAGEFLKALENRS